MLLLSWCAISPSGFAFSPLTPRPLFAPDANRPAKGALCLLDFDCILSVARTRHSKNILVASAFLVCPSGRSSWKIDRRLPCACQRLSRPLPQTDHAGMDRVLGANRNRPLSAG